jgi:hypothetical protein
MGALEFNGKERFTNLFASKFPGLLPLLDFLRPRGWLIVFFLFVFLFVFVFLVLFPALVIFVGTIVGSVFFRSLRFSVSLRVFVLVELAEAEARCEL